MKTIISAWALSLGLLSILGVASAQASASDMRSPISVSHILVAHDSDGVTWATCLSFKNETKIPVQAIKFEFDFQDAFDTTVGSYSGDRVGDFEPGVAIEGPENLYITGFGNIVQKSQNCWVYPQHIASLSSVVVTVLKVRYGDGTIWVNDDPKAVYKANYLSALDGPHPKYIYCGGWLQVKYEYLQAHPELGCWKKYQADHAQWLANHASPIPVPSPSDPR